MRAWTIGLVAMLGLVMLVIGETQAATITVSATCTLQDAVTAANTDTATNGCAAGFGSDEITLGTGTFDGPITINDDLIVTGAGADQSTIDGGGLGTTVTVAAGAVVIIEGVTITGGQGASGADQQCHGSEVSAAPGEPGGVKNSGVLTLIDCVVTANTGGNGNLGCTGVFDDGVGGGEGGPGGILNTGELTLTGVDVSSNTGGTGGDGSPGRTGFSNGTRGPDGRLGGPGGRGGAGGLTNGDTLTLEDSHIEGNQAGTGGGGGHGGSAGCDTCHSCNPITGCDTFTCCGHGGNGGTGGTGGPGGVFVRDFTAIEGDPEVVTGNTGAAGGAGGAGGGHATGGGSDGSPGGAGAAGESDIHQGAQALSWTLAPPSGAFVSTSFTVAAASTSTLEPTISTSGGCSAASTTGSVSVSVDGPAPGPCHVKADQAGNGFFVAAPTLDGAVALENDATVPVVGYTITGTLGANGWYVSDVTLSWTVTEGDSPNTLVKQGCDQVSIVSDQVGTEYTCSATSAGGSISATVTIGRDETDPSLAPTITPAVSALGGPLATASAGATDATSLVASSSCGTVSTASVGAFSVSCSATDYAGNSNSANASYAVANAFLGFQAPLPKTKLVKSNATIPVKFTLGNYQGSGKTSTATARVTIGTTRGGTSLGTTACTFNTRISAYQCDLKTPSSVLTNGTPYYLTVWQQIGTNWVVSPNSGSVVNGNGEVVFFK